MSEFELAHACEIALAAAYQRRGRANADEREACASKIDEIYSRLESMCAEPSGNANELHTGGK